MDYLSNKETSIAIFTKNCNVLQVPYKKGHNDYARGYNAAIKKCNSKADRIMKKLIKAYKEALEDEEDDDDY